MSADLVCAGQHRPGSSRTIGSSGTDVNALTEKWGRRDPGSAGTVPPRSRAGGLRGRYGAALALQSASPACACALPTL
jgi:hypothetical protein